MRFASGRIEIDHDPERIAPEQLVDAVATAGYASKVA